MKTLVVGGTGMIGAHIAELLARHGHTVSVMSRSVGTDPSPGRIAGMPQITGDYLSGISPLVLESFDTVVFSAGQDIRHVEPERDTAEVWAEIQGRAVTAFAEASRQAGVSRFIQIGSYYHYLFPEWAEHIPYVAGRKMADEGARTLTTGDFGAITLNPPSIVGAIPGVSLRRFGRMFSWLKGERAEEVFAPPGGTNYMSADASAEAALGGDREGRTRQSVPCRRGKPLLSRVLSNDRGSCGIRYHRFRARRGMSLSAGPLHCSRARSGHFLRPTRR